VHVRKRLLDTAVGTNWDDLGIFVRSMFPYCSRPFGGTVQVEFQWPLLLLQALPHCIDSQSRALRD